MENRNDAEVQRLCDLLEKVVGASKRSQRELEGELGLSSARLSKILRGTVHLQVRHLLLLLTSLGIPPGEFFAVAYPPHLGEPHPLIAAARLLVQRAETTEVSLAEILFLREELDRLFRSKLAAQELDAAQSS